jgi:hypothetical protein
MDELRLLPVFNYYIDEFDPDIVVLCRQDGAFVAAFSTHVATRECMFEAAKEDYRALVEANKDSLWSPQRPSNERALNLATRFKRMGA